MHLTKHQVITIGARDSKLSIIQTEEVISELNVFYPDIRFSTKLLKTSGDLNQKTPLIEMEKTDFFTKELDMILLNKGVQITIHSAKDLPDPIPNGLKIVAITKGQDPRDILIFRKNESLESLGANPLVGTSSKRREKAIRELIPGAQLVQIRGTVPDRIKQLEKGDIDILISAEAAIIRLGMTNLSRMFLEGEHAPLQGKLAILSRADDTEMKELFQCIDIQN